MKYGETYGDYYLLTIERGEEQLVPRVFYLNARQRGLIEGTLRNAFREGKIKSWSLELTNVVAPAPGQFFDFLSYDLVMAAGDTTFMQPDDYKVTGKKGKVHVEMREGELPHFVEYNPQLEFMFPLACKHCGCKTLARRANLAYCGSECYNAAMMEQGEWYQAKFDIDGEPNVVGWTLGERWNGWATPHFEFDEAMKVANHFNGYYDEQIDAFVFGESEAIPEEERERIRATYLKRKEDPETFTALINEMWLSIEEPETLTIAGEERKVYSIGSGSWTWTEEKL